MAVALIFTTSRDTWRAAWPERLAASGFPVVSCPHADELLNQIQSLAPPSVIAYHLVESTQAAIAAARQVRARSASSPIVLCVRESSEAYVLQALRIGVSDFLRQPISEHELISSLQRLSRQFGLSTPSMPSTPGSTLDTIVGNSVALRRLREYIPKVATADTSVLITGETGVGKELVAELIHAASPRRHRPCLAVNCAAIPETLLESELFGVERGAFTGAEALREGTLKHADGGTVLFDEVGDMGLTAQAKILRAIETREVRRLGGRVQVPIDVRIIAATNQDLERLTADGRFRKDLYYRLNVVRIHMPPLRERKEDLQPLLDHYIRHFNERFHREVEGFTPDALEHLRRHDWPGNIREVRNLVEATFVNLNGRQISFVDLPEAFRVGLAQARSLPSDERDRLLSALFATSWNKSKAAQELHWSRMTLYRKLAKYGVKQAKDAS